MLTIKNWNVLAAIWLLGILAFAFFLALALEGETVPTVRFITSSEAHEKINEHPEAFILDVRSNEEFLERRIPGAVNIPHYMVASAQEILPQDNHTLIFLYCRAGMRASAAATQLAALGYTNIVVFPGMDTWEYETIMG